MPYTTSLPTETTVNSEEVLSNLLEVAPHEQLGKAWVERFPEGDARDAAQFLLDCLTYVSEEDFMQSAFAYFKQIEEEIGDEPYVLVFGSPKKSEEWLATAYGVTAANPPEAIVSTTQQKLRPGPRYYEYLRQHPNVKNIVYIDDAAYSGGSLAAQAGNVLYPFTALNSELEGYRVIIGSIYMTGQAYANLEDSVTLSQLASSRVSVVIPHPYKLPTLVDFLEERFDTADERKDMERKLRQVFKLDLSEVSIQRLSPTYFWHKIADTQSFPHLYVRGEVYDNEGSRINGAEVRFMPDVTPPYKK